MSRIIDIFEQFLDGNGEPLTNGYLQFFQNGSAIPEPTYNDPEETIVNPANVPLDGEGRLTLNTFGSVLYTVKKFNSANVQKGSNDNVRPRGAPDAVAGQLAPWVSTIFYNLNDLVKGDDGKFYLSLSDGNIGNDPVSNPEDWEEIRFIGVWNTNITYEIGEVVQTTDGNLWRALTATAGNDPIVDDGTNWAPATTDPQTTINTANIAALQTVNDGLLCHFFATNQPVIRVAGTLDSTRATEKTGSDNYDNVVTFPIDEIALNGDGAASINAATTNLLIKSEELSNVAAWADTTASFTPTEDSTDIFDIYGNTNLATKFVVTATPTPVFGRQNVTVTATTDYTASLFIYVPTQGGVANWVLQNQTSAEAFPAAAAQTVFDKWVRVSSTLLNAQAATFIDNIIAVNGTTALEGFVFYAMGAKLSQSTFLTPYNSTDTIPEAVPKDDITTQASNNVPDVTGGQWAFKSSLKNIPIPEVSATLYEVDSVGDFKAYLLPNGDLQVDNGSRNITLPNANLANDAIITFDGTTVRGYLDRVLIASNATGALPTANGTTLFIGQDKNKAFQRNGNEQDFKAFSLTKNQAEIDIL